MVDVQAMPYEEKVRVATDAGWYVDQNGVVFKGIFLTSLDQTVDMLLNGFKATPIAGNVADMLRSSTVCRDSGQKDADRG